MLLLPNGDLACFSNDAIAFLSQKNELGFTFEKFLISNEKQIFSSNLIESPFLLPNTDLAFIFDNTEICTIDINTQKLKNTVSYDDEITNPVMLPNGYLAWITDNNSKLMIGSVNEKHIYHELKPFDHEIKSLTLLLNGSLITLSEKNHIVLWKIDYATV